MIGHETAARGRGPVPSPASPPLRSLLAQARMELLLTSRRPENLLVMLVIPVGMLLLFASLSVVPKSAGSAVNFLLPGILALAVISTSMVNLGIATAYERYYGVLKRLGGSPLPRWALLGAKMLAVIAVEVFQVVLLVAIASLALGWRPGEGVNTAAAAVALLLGTVAFAALGMLMAGTLRAEGTLAAANGLYLVLLVVGGVILPLDHLPALLADLGRVLPAAALSEAMRIALGSESSSLFEPMAVLAAWAIVLTALAARYFRWD